MSANADSASSSAGASASPHHTVYREIEPGLATFSVPFSRFGIIPVGGRSTAIKLRATPTGSAARPGSANGSDGSLFVIASSPLDALTRSKIDAMGRVGWLVAPDNVHSLFLQSYADAYPDAKVIGVVGLESKPHNARVRFDGLYGRDPPGTRYGFEDEVDARFFSTFPNRDVAFFHRDSKTLVTADLLFNLPCREQYSATPKGHPSSPVPFLASISRGFNPYSAFHRAFVRLAAGAEAIPDPCVAPGETLSKPGGSAAERKRRFAQDAAAVAGWDFERIIMCHGDVIEDDKASKRTAKSAWIAAYQALLNPDGSSKL